MPSPQQMASRPRHLLDLPDEILCLILGFCCQDLDFLLWPSPFIAAENESCRNSDRHSSCGRNNRRHAKPVPSIDVNISGSGHSVSRTRRLAFDGRSDHCLATVLNKNISVGHSSNRIQTNGTIVHMDRSSSTNNCIAFDTTLRTQRRRTIAEEGQGVASSNSNSIASLRGTSFSRSSRSLDQQTCCDCQRSDASTSDNGSFWSRYFARFLSRSRQEPQPHRHPHGPTPHEFSAIMPNCVKPMAMGSSIIPQPSQRPRQGCRLTGSNTSKLSSAVFHTSTTAVRVPATAGAEAAVLVPFSVLESALLPPVYLGHASSSVQRRHWDRDNRDTGENRHAEKEYNAQTTPASISASTPEPEVAFAYSHATGRRQQLGGISMSSTLNAAVRSYPQAINSSYPPPSSSFFVETVVPSAISLGDAAGGAADGGKADQNILRDGTKFDSGDSKGCQGDKCEGNLGIFRLSTPFQLLLVNRQLADLVVQFLWRAVVFHGHDIGQMQRLLSTLNQDDSLHSTGECVSAAAPIFIASRTSAWTSLSHCHNDGLKPVESCRSQRKAQVCLEDRASSLKENFRRCSPHEQPVIRSTCPEHHSLAQGMLDLSPRGDHTVCPSSPTGAFPRWSYRRLVKRVVLNFAHPQASPQMLVQALECIRSHSPDQIQALDLHANEKMQTAGLEDPAQLERLFGSGFSKLRYLRLQGGLIDNQLFGALIKGLTGPSPAALGAQHCRLSQVFLGPGSITDSAIEKLIKVAGHSLEAFSIASCVDIGGGALASLLTKCPKLRVLSVHRCLARDVELLEGLGVQVDEFGLPILPAIGNVYGGIVAPLERLELGTVKLTVAGVAEIVKGTCRSLRFLVLETQHFKEEFLKNIVAPLCSRLEGLYFEEAEHLPQQQQPHQQQQSGAEQWSRSRFFDFRWTRRATGAESQNSQQRQGQNSTLRLSPGSFGPLRQSHFLSMLDSGPRHSLWLGETSIEEWVVHGGCASWASNTAGWALDTESTGSSGPIPTDAAEAAPGQSRARSFSAYFRAISQRLVSFLSPSSSSTGGDSVVMVLSESTISSSQFSSGTAEGDYVKLLERFGVHAGTIDAVLLSLQPTLRTFKAMRTDLILSSADESGNDGSDQPSCALVLSEERLDTVLRLVVLLGVLVLGAALSIHAAQTDIPVWSLK